MTTQSMEYNLRDWLHPATGRPQIVIEQPRIPKDIESPLLKDINATIAKTLIEEPSSISGTGAIVNRSGTIMMQQAPSPELTRLQRLNHYLAFVREAGDIASNTAETAWQTWKMLSSSMDRPLPVPDAAPGPDGQLLYTWNKGDHHLELEIFPNGPAEFFYLNRVSSETWEEEYLIGNSISLDAKARLTIFI